MSARYARLPNPLSGSDTHDEMEAAFGSDNEEDDNDESTPLTHTTTPQLGQRDTQPANPVPGAYDFEREYSYDYPPPGSPPRPSARALPNEIGNSNGFLPTSPIQVPRISRSFFRRAVGSILPTHYAPIPLEAQASRVRGGGIENDGVFANVMAKPQPAQVVQSEDGQVHIVPEDNQKETPPTYSEAQADAVPPYWETTVIAPGLEPGADMIIEDLPTGSVLVFCLNVFVSFFFQFVGFFLTYLLHTSHAGKFGSRAGLGLTLIQYGLYSRSVSDGMLESDDSDPWSATSVNPVDRSNGTAPVPDDTNTQLLSLTSKDWLSFLFMTLGWFLLLSSCLGYWRVKRWESSVRSPPAPPTRADIEHDINVRRNLTSIFGVSFEEDAAAEERAGMTPALRAQESRLARDLRAAGLI